MNDLNNINISHRYLKHNEYLTSFYNDHLSISYIYIQNRVLLNQLRHFVDESSFYHVYGELIVCAACGEQRAYVCARLAYGLT